MQTKEIKINLNKSRSFKITVNDKYKGLLTNQVDFFNALDHLLVLKIDKKVQVGMLPSLNAERDSLLVKKFTYDASFHKYLRKMISSRAKHLWDISLVLKKNNISISEPVLFFDDFPNNISVFVSRFIDNSRNLGSIAKDDNSLLSKDMAESLILELVSFHHNGFVHNDLKWSNILINNDCKVIIIDLDNVKQYKHFNKTGIKKDLIRFYRFALEVDSIKWIEDYFFPLYLNKINIDFIDDMFVRDIRKCALQEWEKYGCRKL